MSTTFFNIIFFHFQEEEERVAQLLKLADQYKNGLKTATAYLNEVKKVVGQAKE